MSASRAPATYQGAGTREQLLEGKRLAEIVVGTGVEPAHPVADRVARREEEDGRGPALAAMILQDSKAVVAGQPPVEDHKVPFAVPQRRLTRIAVASVRDRETLVRQPVDNRSSEACVVLDHQNPARHGKSSDLGTTQLQRATLVEFQHKRSDQRRQEGQHEGDFRVSHRPIGGRRRYVLVDFGPSRDRGRNRVSQRSIDLTREQIT